MADKSQEKLTLVARKPSFGLPTACPYCLPVYLYLKFARIPFDLCFNGIYPDSDQIPYVEAGTYVAYNNEKSGVIEGLKEDGIVDLDSSVQTIPEWISMKAMVETWLKEAALYELWLGVYSVKQLLGITKENSDKREMEIYGRANAAYKALSTLLGDESFLYGERATSLDAIFLGHALFILQALPETSTLRSKLLQFNNLVKYTEKHSQELIEVDSLSSSASLPKTDPSSSTPKQGGFSNWSSKPKKTPKKERSEEEKKFRRRAKYFLAAQVIAVLVFMSLLSGSEEAELELEDDDGILNVFIGMI
ncbi:hypothetical protein V2J09_002384 [Rumex salicifolius]